MGIWENEPPLQPRHYSLPEHLFFAEGFGRIPSDFGGVFPLKKASFPTGTRGTGWYPYPGIHPQPLLVGGWTTHLKNMRQIESFPQFSGWK